MNKVRLAAAILIPPILLLGWVAIDLWRLISQGIFHPLTTELKLVVLPWFVLAAPTIYLLMSRGLTRYWHF
ncbi:MAG TPA: hypothetical protein VM240_12450, partial [Verrucomicrobiae bacterium]|nr:hypothetical protein [Verrucomicrobiae bacterium]